MLKITNLTKKFKGKVALNDINIELNNCVYGMLGENGAGKTTLMRCISGLYDYDSGKIIIDGKDLDTNLTEIKKKIGIVCQESKLDQSLSVYSNLINKAYLYGIIFRKSKFICLI